MKLKLAKSALLDGLQKVQNIVGMRSTLPILANVLITTDKNKVCLTTTDLDVTIRCQVEAEIIKEGKSTLPVKRLSSIIRELPDSTIDLEIDEKDLAKIECNASVFKIYGIPENDFPPVPTPENKYFYTLDQGVFKEMMRKTAYAASTDETRYVLNGILLSFREGKLTVVATDGRRLALVEHEIEIPAEAEKDFILPSKAVNELMHTLEDDGTLKIYASENQAIFEFNEVMIASKLIDGTYPNYKQVIPVQCEERIAIERESLLIALRRASILAADKSSATKLGFTKNKLTILTNTPDVGEAKDTIPIKYTGKDISVAFNPDFMMDPLRNLANDEIFLEITDELSPGVIKCDIPFLYVLMPMRIS